MRTAVRSRVSSGGSRTPSNASSARAPDCSPRSPSGPDPVSQLPDHPTVIGDFGSQSMAAPLRRVLMRSAASAMRDADPVRWHYGAGFDPVRAAEQHRALVDLVSA